MNIEWLIDDALWSRVRSAPASERRMQALIRQLESNIQSHQFIGRGYLGDNRSKLRFNKADRLPVKVERAADPNDRRVYLYDIVPHLEGEELSAKGGASLDARAHAWVGINPDVTLVKSCDAEGATAFQAHGFRALQATDEVLERIDSVDDCDLDWRLSDKQLEAVRLPGPVILCGSAGSGKSTIAIARMVCANRLTRGRTLYLTYSETLRAQARSLWMARVAADPSLEASAVEFETLDSYARRLVGAEVAASQFPLDRRCSMADAPLFVRFEKAHLPAGWSRQLAWEELRSVIKGGCLLGTHGTASFQAGLSLERYRALPERREGCVSPALIDSDDRDFFYESVFKTYEKQLRADANRVARWDDMDLARAALGRLDEKITAAANAEEGQATNPRYDFVFLDEVQDLAPVQIAVAILSCSTGAGFFAAGDMQQSVQPANFAFGRLGELMHQHGWKAPQPFRLEQNFRSLSRIVELGNAVALERNRLLREHNAELQTTNIGGAVAHLLPQELDALSSEGGLSASLMIIAEEEHRSEAEAVFQTKTVLSLEQAKGLECKTVVLWRLFEASALQRGPWGENPDTTRSRLRHQLSCITVGMSRARERLIFVDDALPHQWKPFADFRFDSPSEALEQLRRAMREVSSSQDYRKRADEQERHGNFRSAAEFFDRAECSMDAARCRAFDAASKGDHAAAAILFEEAALPDEADGQLLLGKQPARRLALWTRWAHDPARPSWQRLIMDVRAAGVSWEVALPLLRHLDEGDTEARPAALALGCATLSREMSARPQRAQAPAHTLFALAPFYQSVATIHGWTTKNQGDSE